VPGAARSENRVPVGKELDQVSAQLRVERRVDLRFRQNANGDVVYGRHCSLSKIGSFGAGRPTRKPTILNADILRSLTIKKRGRSFFLWFRASRLYYIWRVEQQGALSKLYR
jgi:hypothetical protein